jgi:flagellar basal-body rod protein FlgF
VQPVDRLKLVKPGAENLTKTSPVSSSRARAPAPVDETLAVNGHLEGNNVSAVEEMVATAD